MIKAGPSEGVFDSSVVKDLFEAFEKAGAHVNRADSTDVPDTDREDLARRIIPEFEMINTRCSRPATPKSSDLSG